MKIIKLVANNFKGIKAIEIEPKTNLVRIEGPNGNGKTSVLDCIEAAIRKSNFSPDQPVRLGENKADLSILLSNGVRIDKEYDAGGLARMKVYSADGKEYKSPRKMLDDLASSISYDPSEFLLLKQLERVELLKNILKLDFTEENKEISKFYEKRKNEHVLKLSVENTLKDKFQDVVKKEVGNIEKILEEKRKADEHNKMIQSVRRDIFTMEQELEAKQGDIEKHEEAAEHYKSLYEKSLADKNLCISLAQSLPVEIEETKKSIEGMEEIDTSKFDSQVRQHSEDIKLNEKYNQKVEMLEQLKKHDEKWREYDNEIFKNRELKIKKIKNSQFPVGGLFLDDDGGKILYNGVNLDQVNSAKQIEISLMMAISLNPLLKVIRIKNGSYFDESSMKIIEDIAEKNDFQIWIEKVEEEKTCDSSFYIEKGEVK